MTLLLMAPKPKPNTVNLHTGGREYLKDGQEMISFWGL